jgi:hypothetical protein
MEDDERLQFGVYSRTLAQCTVLAFEAVRRRRNLWVLAATCTYCEQDMETGASCVEVAIDLIDGRYAPIPWGSMS